MSRTGITAGDRVVLFGKERWLVEAGTGTHLAKGLGHVDTDGLVGRAWGDEVDVQGGAVVLLRPTLPDLEATLRRKAQLILPKDLSRIVFELGLSPGDHVLEAGIGSAAATLALAHAVGADGHVTVQELRGDFADWGRMNVGRAGLGDRVTVVLGDLTQELAAEGPFDALLLDLPEPAKALPRAWGALATGARVACYTPQVSQMEAAVRTLRGLDAADVRALETIERAWETKDRGSRPAFEGLGHTGFLVFARKIW